MKVNKYNRNDLVNQISYKLNMNKDESRIILDCVLDSFIELILSNDGNSRIELRDFGVFKTSLTNERTNARNPKTKESVIIPPRKKLVFKVSKRIKNELNQTLNN